MFALLKKEIGSFLFSLIGAIVIIVFLLISGLFLWVFPGNFNILDAGITSMESLFVIAPWVFLFLIPAITMRTFSEEKRNGTLELLLTKPLSEWQIILAKYLAGLILVVIALIPTFVYVIRLQALGNPPGNLDLGATWGSYAGLIFLAGAFLAIGLLTSSLTDNQVISFISAMFACFFVYFGFDAIGGLEIFKPIDSIIYQLGINLHFASMSRGVIDSRDLIYFLSLIFLILYITRFSLLRR